MNEQIKTSCTLAGIVLAIVLLSLLIPVYFPTPPMKDSLLQGPPAEAGTERLVLIEEFSDFQCPFCAKAAPAVKALRQAYRDDVVISYRHFPLTSTHPDALLAAEASECARDQDLFWAYHDILFENQGKLSKQHLTQYAEQLGMDAEAFTTCLDSGKKKRIIEKDMAAAITRNVRGTPTFFVDGEMMAGVQPLSAFGELIRKAQRRSNQSAPEGQG